jgi:hypothetical protein
MPMTVESRNGEKQLVFKRRANLVNAWDLDILLCQTRARFLVHQLPTGRWLFRSARALARAVLETFPMISRNRGMR